jgi:hypothetical protein
MRGIKEMKCSDAVTTAIDCDVWTRGPLRAGFRPALM